MSGVGKAGRGRSGGKGRSLGGGGGGGRAETGRNMEFGRGIRDTGVSAVRNVETLFVFITSRTMYHEIESLLL
jgi:hypothetical protein